MDIKYNDLGAQWNLIKEKTLDQIITFVEKGFYISEKESSEFEKRFSDYCGTKYAIAVSNGTDALKLTLQVLKLKEPVCVIIPANTFISLAFAASYFQYNLVLIDCDKYYQIDIKKLEEWLIKNRVNYESVVIIPVHMYGHPCDMGSIIEMSKKYDFRIIEDCSQAHGAKCTSGIVGSLGDLAAFSCYPGKNLGAIGDAGIITTNNQEFYERLKLLRNLGSRGKYVHEVVGWNNRIDNLQAIILSEKLEHLDDWNNKRIKVARQYCAKLQKIKGVKLPGEANWCGKAVYHIFAIRTKKRDSLQEWLNSNGIPTIIHYPIPIQKSEPYKVKDFGNHNTVSWCHELLSLPIHPFLKKAEVSYICQKIRAFFE